MRQVVGVLPSHSVSLLGDAYALAVSPRCQKGEPCVGGPQNRPQGHSSAVTGFLARGWSGGDTQWVARRPEKGSVKAAEPYFEIDMKEKGLRH